MEAHRPRRSWAFRALRRPNRVARTGGDPAARPICLARRGPARSGHGRRSEDAHDRRGGFFRSAGGGWGGARRGHGNRQRRRERLADRRAQARRGSRADFGRDGDRLGRSARSGPGRRSGSRRGRVPRALAPPARRSPSAGGTLRSSAGRGLALRLEGGENRRTRLARDRRRGGVRRDGGGSRRDARGRLRSDREGSGKGLRRRRELTRAKDAFPVSSTFRRFTGTPSYLTNESLEAAVNCALSLERPLLVKGEPGTGKTLLAQAIAETLSAELIHWPVKSTTRAQDGLYVYDTVQRLYDARFGEGDVKDIRHYIKLGPLGRAFAAEQRLVLLIDEVDKADLEFPNDLLHEIDRMRFVIPETGDEVVAKNRPIVVITSNNEKELPDAFLRRCVFHFIDFPDQELMKRIVRVHHPQVEGAIVDQAVVAFYELRAVPRLRKRPSTSELVDWISVLMQSGVGRDRLIRELPFLGVLLKKEQDVELLRAVRAGGVRR